MCGLFHDDLLRVEDLSNDVKKTTRGLDIRRVWGAEF